MYSKDTSGYYRSTEKNYKDLSFRMSNKKMADVMYAILMTGATLTSSFHMGWKYTRKQNGYNQANVRIEIAPHMELEFETIVGVKLTEIPKISMNMAGRDTLY